MEVRRGYKQTEVGMIPEDWDVKHLGELALVTAGGTPSRAIARYWNGDIPWITTSEVGFRAINHAEQFITKEGLNNSAAKLLPPGTLLMALYGQGKTRGKVGVLGIEATTNQACAAISVGLGVSSSFMLHFLGSQYEAIRKLSNTGNQENLNSSLVRSIPIVLPPKTEQEAIAEALSDADALIESLEQLLAKKRQLKQGAMQELLGGKKRLPGFEVKLGYKQTEVGVIPEDWEVKAVHEFAAIKTGPFGTLLKASEYSDGEGVPLISVGEIREGFLRITDHTPRVSGAVMRRLPQYVLRRGDIVFGRKGGVERSALIRQPQEGWFLGSDGLSVRPSRDSHAEYLAFQFQSARIQGWLLQNAIGTTMPSLNQEILRNVAIPLSPTKAEQEAIAVILSDMDAEIAALEAKLAKARQVKQGMMQELLTGRIRLV